MSQSDTFQIFIKKVTALLRFHYGVQLRPKAKTYLQAFHSAGYTPADTVSYIARNDGLAPLQAAR